MYAVVANELRRAANVLDALSNGADPDLPEEERLAHFELSMQVDGDGTPSQTLSNEWDRLRDLLKKQGYTLTELHDPDGYSSAKVLVTLDPDLKMQPDQRGSEKHLTLRFADLSGLL